ELYDLVVDPSESNNVADDHPEVVQRLSKMVRSWTAELPKNYVKLGK
ncbi:MAG TPA: Cerebroside-sulfatase, partial [Planctomycetaceae bacterium]|nr:Cerebroside-sulfatase [Planctomycetaceae bacterium]